MDEGEKPVQMPKKRRRYVDAFALPHLSFATRGLDSSGLPSPQFIVGALTFHLLLLLALMSIPPVDFKRDEILPVQIVEEQKPPEEIKKPIEEKHILPKPLEKLIQKLEPPKPKEVPKPIEKPKPQEMVKSQDPQVPIPAPIPTPKEVPKPAETQIPKELPQVKVEVKQLKLQPVQKPLVSKMEELKPDLQTKIIVPEQIEDFKLPEIKDKKVDLNGAKSINPNARFQSSNPNVNTKIIVPEQIEDFKLPDINVQQKSLGTNRQIDQFKGKIVPNTNIQTKIDIPNDAPPAPNVDLKKQQEEALKRQKELEALSRQNANSQLPAINVPSSVAPIAPNGELARPSGVVNLGNPLPSGGGQPAGGIKAGGGPVAPSAGGFGDGTLPRRPPSYGGAKGRNQFEEGDENGSLLGRVGTSLDCSKLGVKERKEKCPNWSPLEGRHSNIAPKVPIDLPKNNPNQNPLVPCKNSPNSNLGLGCLPSKTPLNKNQ